MSGVASQPRVAVSIVTHNRLPELQITLRALQELNPQPDLIMVYADACTDGTQEAVLRDFPHVKLLASVKPGGSIAGRDEMLRAAPADIVLSLDDDSHPIEPDFIARLRELHQKYPRAAILSFPQRSDEFPETMKSHAINRGTPPLLVASYGGGAASYLRSAYLALPGFVREFFHTYEEPDYALQCCAHGWQVVFHPSLTIRHRYTPRGRSTHRTHSLHSRNEMWSVLLRCPWPLLPPVVPFRLARQLFSAARIGGWRWMLREPSWWWAALVGMPALFNQRRAVSVGAYLDWMALSRQPREIN